MNLILPAPGNGSNGGEWGGEGGSVKQPGFTRSTPARCPERRLPAARPYSLSPRSSGRCLIVLPSTRYTTSSAMLVARSAMRSRLPDTM